MIKIKIDESIKDIKNVNIDFKEVRNQGNVLWRLNTIPGSSTLIGGNMEAGFFGEVPTSELISGDELAKLIGLTAGTSQYSDEPWLKFAYEGDILYIAKKPFRCNLSWDDINAVKAVYGDRIETIKGSKYAIMLPRGTGKDVQPDPKVVISEFEGAVNHNSMWNKLMLPIHQKAPSNWAYTNNVKSPTENWNVGYTDADLITRNSNGNGSRSICQETVDRASNRIYRGASGVSYANSYWDSITHPYNGWRPVLKLIV